MGQIVVLVIDSNFNYHPNHTIDCNRHLTVNGVIL